MNPVGSYVVLTWFKHLKRWQGHLLDGPVSSFSNASCKRPCLTHSSYRCKCLAPFLFTRSLKICTTSKGCDSDHWLLCCRTFCCKWYENRLMPRTIELCLLNLNISDSPRLVLDHHCGECSWFWWIVTVDLPLCSFTRAPRNLCLNYTTWGVMVIIVCPFLQFATKRLPFKRIWIRGPDIIVPAFLWFVFKYLDNLGSCVVGAV